MPYFARRDTEGGTVEERVAVVGTAGVDYRIVEWLEGPLHETRSRVPLIHLRYEKMYPEERGVEAILGGDNPRRDDHRA